MDLHTVNHEKAGKESKAMTKPIHFFRINSPTIEASLLNEKS